MYIKLDESMNLVITVNDELYRGDNLNRKIIYLIPTQIGEINILTASVYLSFIRADGVADVVLLERMNEKYKETYFQYTVPVTCKLTKYPGEVCSWLQIYTGTPSNPSISKSGECTLIIRESKNMDDYLCDHQMTALYQLQKSIEQGAVDIANKADNLVYDEETRKLQLKSGETLLGDAVTVPSDSYSDGEDDDGDNTWDDMSGSGDESSEYWEPM